MRYPIYEAARVNFKAARTRRVIEKMYEEYPDKTIEHVNVELDTASRLEERRAQILEVFAE